MEQEISPDPEGSHKKQRLAVCNTCVDEWEEAKKQEKD